MTSIHGQTRTGAIRQTNDLCNVAKRALILVDLQNDFLPGGALAVPDGDAVLPVANCLQANFDLVIATQDWHPVNHVSFAASHPGRAVGDEIQVNRRQQKLWPAHCVQGTHGAALADALDKRRIAQVVQKGTDQAVDSYSGFFDDFGRPTELGKSLRDTGVTTVYIMGLATDYCVRATALDARRSGFEVTVVIDGCRGVDRKDTARALDEMAAEGVTFADSASLLNR